MGKQRMRILVLAILVILALSLNACTLSASTPPATSITVEVQDTPDEFQATMESARVAALTSTAVASESVGATSTDALDVSGTPATTGTPLAVTPLAGTPLATLPLGVTEYTVKPGDWIWQIARTYGIDPQDIIDLNELTNPSLIQPGLVLKIPAPAGAPASTGTPETTGTPQAGGTTHIVQVGEWLWQIARTYGVDPQAIVDANNLANPSDIYPGQELIIP